MERTERLPRDVAIPVAGLATLRRALQKEAGALPAIHALHAAGFGAGEALWDSLRRSATSDLSGMDEAVFWDRISAALGRRGWGSLSRETARRGVGLLSSADWAEAAPGTGERQPSCAFSTGMLSALLTGAAAGPVAVLEVACRTRGDDHCTFAFGSGPAVHELYGALLEGRELEPALAAL